LVGHGSHFSAFFVPEAVPAAHGRQPRSAVAVGCVTACSPFAHAACGKQKPFPAFGWNVVFEHGSHATAFSFAEYCPTAHFSHVLPLTIVPGLQMPQYPPDAPPQPLRCPPTLQTSHGLQLLCPGKSWYMFTAHALQIAAPAADKKPAGHGAHVA
jgi:hypothetical protein